VAVVVDAGQASAATPSCYHNYFDGPRRAFRMKAFLARTGADHSTADLLAKTSVLSKREFEIARLVAKDASNLAIAERLFISERTVESHVRNNLTKLGGVKRARITAWVRSNDVGSRP
jgi:DNA-binding CsgD family transcriptional regulator